MKKKTFMRMYWIGTLLFFTTLKDVYLWQGIVLTCLAGGLIAIILPKAVRQYKELKLFDCLIYAVLLGISVGLTVIGIAIICVKYF